MAVTVQIVFDAADPEALAQGRRCRTGSPLAAVAATSTGALAPV